MVSKSHSVGGGLKITLSGGGLKITFSGGGLKITFSGGWSQNHIQWGVVSKSH